MQVILSIVLLLLIVPALVSAQEESESAEADSAVNSAADSAREGASVQGAGVRIKEIAEIEGVRTNQLVGFGIVTGLEGSGDSTRSALMKKLISNLVAAFDVEIEEGEVQSRNSAVAMVTADTPPYVRSGQRINVTVSSLQDARSLEGGILLQTPLKGADGTVYAVAQGQVSASVGEDGNGTVGRVVEGALIEREILSLYLAGGSGESGAAAGSGISLLLKRPDFSTAYAVYNAVSSAFSDLEVTPVDASKVRVGLNGMKPARRMEIISRIENLRIIPDTSGKVVINSASGVVVMGTSVRIGPISVSYDSAELDVGPFAAPSAQSAGSEPGENTRGGFLLDSTTSVGDLVSVLKEAGLSIDDIIEIVKTIERAGALYGTLEVM